MSEWKGPWKCEKCGQVFMPGVRGYTCWERKDPLCNGKSSRPHDRRAPDPDLLALLREARDIIAVDAHEWGDSTSSGGLTTLVIRMDAKVCEMEGEIMTSEQREQAEKAMPLIGPMLDAWDALPNDVKCDEELENLSQHIDALMAAMEEESDG